MSRLARKNRTDIDYKESGGIFDIFDNDIKLIWRINDAEYDFIAENATDKQLITILSEDLTISELKESLTVIDKLIDKYNNQNDEHSS